MEPKENVLCHGVDWAVKAGVTDEVILGTRLLVRRRRQRRLAAAAGVAVILFACGFLFFSKWRFVSAVSTPISVIVDMPRRHILPDGSVVEFKDDSSISVFFTPSFRRVVLLKGQAHFRVAKNKNRPFLVIIGNVEVRAVGTAFSAQRSDLGVEILVTDGRVVLGKLPTAFLSSESPASPTITDARMIATVDAGSRAVVKFGNSSDSLPVSTVEALSISDISQRLAWRVPRLEFTQTPLGEVIKMLNKYSQERLSLSGESLENIRISGVLRTDHIETLLRLLDSDHGIKSERRPDGEIVLTMSR